MKKVSIEDDEPSGSIQPEKRQFPHYEKNRYPYCIVWTPLPLITWLIPCIGHTGICSSEGIIHDFAGPYTVNIDDMAFGNPTKYVPLDICPQDSEKWDESLVLTDRRYRQMMHNLCCNNCHSHVACVLNSFGYGTTEWNMISIWWICCTRSSYVGVEGFVKTYFGFVVIVAIVLALIYLV
jgi:hypothetical protein